MNNWRDNKYGHEAGYSALNEAEGLGHVLRFVVVVVAIVGAVAGLLWWLLTL